MERKKKAVEREHEKRLNSVLSMVKSGGKPKFHRINTLWASLQAFRNCLWQLAKSLPRLSAMVPPFNNND